MPPEEYVGHWAIDDFRDTLHLYAWQNTSNQYAEIALVDNVRACRQMLRYAQLGEEIERLVDAYYGGENNPQKFIEAVLIASTRCVADTGQNHKVPCPEIRRW